MVALFNCVVCRIPQYISLIYSQQEGKKKKNREWEGKWEESNKERNFPNGTIVKKRHYQMGPSPVVNSQHVLKLQMIFSSAEHILFMYKALQT